MEPRQYPLHVITRIEPIDGEHCHEIVSGAPLRNRLVKGSGEFLLVCVPAHNQADEQEHAVRDWIAWMPRGEPGARKDVIERFNEATLLLGRTARESSGEEVAKRTGRGHGHGTASPLWSHSPPGLRIRQISLDCTPGPIGVVMSTGTLFVIT